MMRMATTKNTQIYFIRNSFLYSREETFVESFQTIDGKIFWQCTVFVYKIDLPQVKWNLMSSMTNFVKELPRDLWNDLKLGLRKFGNERIISKSDGTQPSIHSPLWM